MLVSYQAPCGASSHCKPSFDSQSPMPVTTDAHRASGSCCGDRPELISRELRLSNDAEGAKAESEIYLKEKIIPCKMSKVPTI